MQQHPYPYTLFDQENEKWKKKSINRRRQTTTIVIISSKFLPYRIGNNQSELLKQSKKFQLVSKKKKHIWVSKKKKRNQQKSTFKEFKKFWKWNRGNILTDINTTNIGERILLFKLNISNEKGGSKYKRIVFQVACIFFYYNLKSIRRFLISLRTFAFTSTTSNFFFFPNLQFTQLRLRFSLKKKA